MVVHKGKKIKKFVNLCQKFMGDVIDDHLLAAEKKVCESASEIYRRVN